MQERIQMCLIWTLSTDPRRILSTYQTVASAHFSDTHINSMKSKRFLFKKKAGAILVIEPKRTQQRRQRKMRSK